MKKICAALFLIAALFVAGAEAAYNREVIEALESAVEVNEDASVTVTEQYDFTALGVEISRGLVLGIPTVYKTSSGTRHAKLEILSVTLDGEKAQVAQTTTAAGMSLRVGNPDKLLARGSHTIILRYRMYKMVGFFEDHDELYWNAVGTSINFPVMSARSAVKLPNRDWGQGFKSIEWYTGRDGAKGNPSAAALASDNSVETTEPLAPGEGLTVVFTWEKGIIMPPPPNFFDKFGGTQYLIAALLMGIFYLGAWFKVGRDKPLGTVIPLFYPPAVDPGTVRYVVEQQEDADGFTANLIDLAVKGYVKIGEDKNVTRTDKKIDENLPNAERSLLENMFNGTQTVSLDGYSERVMGARSANELCIKGVGDSLFTRNSGFWAAGMLFLLVFPLLDFLGQKGAAFPENLAAPGAALLAGLFGVGMTAKKRGMFVKILILAAFALLTIFVDLIGSLVSYADDGEDIFILAFIAATACSLMITLFFHLMPNYNAGGQKLLADAAGLKIYMNTAEKGRLEMFNPPEETPEVFERLLPWAFALGVAKTWANKFAKVLEQANYKPSWYDGEPAYLFYGGGMNSFASNVSMASVMPSPKFDPTSSSGSGGGGFSGGGGGGTSVGGW